MSGLAEGLGLWALGGLVWWAAALAVALPYRFRHRTWLSWARFTVGLPLTVAAWLEVSRSRRRARSGRGRVPTGGSPRWSCRLRWRRSSRWPPEWWSRQHAGWPVRVRPTVPR